MLKRMAHMQCQMEYQRWCVLSLSQCASPDVVVQASQSDLLKSKSEANRLREELSASESDCAALRDTVDRQSKEISSLKVCFQRSRSLCTLSCE